MEYSEFSKKVWAWIPDPIAYPEDKPSIEIDIQTMHRNGWTYIEAQRYLNCREEVTGSGPEAISEERALAIMAKTIDAVRTRLGKQDVLSP